MPITEADLDEITDLLGDVFKLAVGRRERDTAKIATSINNVKRKIIELKTKLNKEKKKRWFRR